MAFLLLGPHQSIYTNQIKIHCISVFMYEAIFFYQPRNKTPIKKVTGKSTTEHLLFFLAPIKSWLFLIKTL